MRGCSLGRNIAIAYEKTAMSFDTISQTVYGFHHSSSRVDAVAVLLVQEIRNHVYWPEIPLPPARQSREREASCPQYASTTPPLSWSIDH